MGKWWERNRSAILSAVVPALAFAVTYLILQVPLGDEGPASRKFKSLPEFHIWEITLGAVLAVGTAMIPAVWSELCEVAKLRNDPAHARPTAEATPHTTIRCRLDWQSLKGPVAATLVVLFLGGLLYFHVLPRKQPPLESYSWRIGVFFALVAASAAPAVTGIFAVRTGLSFLVQSVTDPAQRLSHLLVLRQGLRRFVAALGGLISVGVVAIGALRNALLAYQFERPPEGSTPAAAVAKFAGEYPASYVLLYGGLFTALMALAYIPTYVRWQDRARGVRDELYKVPHLDSLSTEWMTKRTNMDKLLGIDAGVTASLNAAFGILAPFAGSVLSFFLEGASGS